MISCFVAVDPDKNFPWSDWGSCSVSCGAGQKQRTRNCSIVEGTDFVCPCPRTETVECNLGSCPGKSKRSNQVINWYIALLILSFVC